MGWVWGLTKTFFVILLTALEVSREIVFLVQNFVPVVQNFVPFPYLVFQINDVFVQYSLASAQLPTPFIWYPECAKWPRQNEQDRSRWTIGPQRTKNFHITCKILISKISCYLLYVGVLRVGYCCFDLNVHFMSAAPSKHSTVNVVLQKFLLQRYMLCIINGCVGHVLSIILFFLWTRTYSVLEMEVLKRSLREVSFLVHIPTAPVMEENFTTRLVIYSLVLLLME